MPPCRPLGTKMSEERAQWILDATRDGCIESLRSRLADAHAAWEQQRREYRRRIADARRDGELVDM